jgi:hypothetical protein
MECGGKSPNIVFADAPDLEARRRGRGQRHLLQPGRGLHRGLAPAGRARASRTSSSARRARPAQAAAGRSARARRRRWARWSTRGRCSACWATSTAAARRARGWRWAASAPCASNGGYYIEPTVFDAVAADHAHRPRGDLRPGAGGDRLRRRRAGHRDRQRQPLRARRRRVDPRHHGAHRTARRCAPAASGSTTGTAAT